MALIAQVVSDNPLATFGLAGLVIAWFMWFVDKLRSELRSLAHRLDGLTRAILMDLLSRDDAGTQAKIMAQQELAKLQAREKE
jgi:hypothetical protein